jgi:hypothetical protein
MRRNASLLAAVALFTALSAQGAPPDPDKLPVTQVRDLHYGDVLFYFYQEADFEAITRLTAYEQWNRLPSHGAEAQLLLGGLYLSLGLHNEAGERFERLLTPEVPAGVRDRAWFYLAKVWYARGYLERAEQAISQVRGALSPQLEAEKMHLLSNVLLRQDRFDEAAKLLAAWQGPPDWQAYAQFNLGVALVRQGRIDDANPLLTAVGTLDTARPELLALKDRANLALGFAYLQAQRPAEGRAVLERVRLDGPYSNRALLGAGWADAALGEFRRALGPWLELRERDLLDAAVQEAYLAVPYAFAQLEANSQAAEYYETAIRSFDDEGRNLDASIGRIHAGKMLDAVLEQSDDARYGWFWQLRSVPDAPESRYLYTVLASHDFQEGIKNYRDLDFMSRTLERWGESMEAFDDMIDTRGLAYAERLPRADVLLASRALEGIEARREDLRLRLNAIEARTELAALGTDEERAQWERVRAVEDALAAAPADEETAALRERLRLVKGVLQFRLSEAFKARTWQQRRSLRELDVAVREAQNRWIRVDRARRNAPSNTGEFATRMAALRGRIGALNVRLADASARQNEFLEQLAVAELEKQKARLATYQIQARFALASIYDRAANPPAPPPAAAPER